MEIQVESTGSSAFLDPAAKVRPEPLTALERNPALDYCAQIVHQ